jgi:signal transduction histidine kinase
VKLLPKLLFVVLATVVPVGAATFLVGHFDQPVVVALAAGAVLGVACAAAVARSQRSRIAALKHSAEAVSTGDLSQMIRTSSKDELGELIDVFNRMSGGLLEERRRREVESWKQLVRVLGHEINNTLAPIGSLADTLRTSVAPRIADAAVREDVRESAQVIADRAEHLRRFVERYALIAKLPPPTRRRLKLDDAARDAARLLSGEFAEKKVRLLQDYDTGGAAADLDPAQFGQVVINLLKNALEACAPGGVVGLETHRTGDGLELRVHDDGRGFTPDALQKAFTPFFTTKPGGSGIGLALARQIARAHGGDIALESGGGGTTVRVAVPAAS